LFNDDYIANLYENKGRNYVQLFKAYIIRIFKVLKCLGTKKIVFIEYELLPYFPPILEYLLYKTKVKVILDYDDAIFHNYDQHQSFTVRSFLKNKIKVIAKYAHLIITGSPYLSSYFLQYNKEVVEIPTSILFEKYESSLKNNTINDFVNIGWIGSKSTSINVINISYVIRKMQLNNPKILFKLMGFDKSIESQLNFSNVEFYDWSENQELIFLNAIDLGIMPLANTSFNQGKCGFKLIQYMAMGKPTISSPLEANVKINRNSHNMFATSNQEWYECINKFITNTTFYREVGVKNREIVRQYYSVEVNTSLYIELFKKIQNVRN
jgi:glycosyltransferase involved in cell wall biosynthesis